MLFDTQLIIERKENGDDDYIRHSIDLFLDFVAIFRRLLIILASKVTPNTLHSDYIYLYVSVTIKTTLSLEFMIKGFHLHVY